MPIELTYGEVEATLADLNRIADEKRIAFKARLKHFQRLGFPEGANTGTGKRAAYTVSMLFKLVLAVELTQVGMTPKLVADVIERNWLFLAESLIENLDAIVADDREMTSFHWSVKADALIELKRIPQVQETFGVISAFPVDDIASWIGNRRNVILNGPLLVTDVLASLENVGISTTINSVVGDLIEQRNVLSKDPRHIALLRMIMPYYQSLDNNISNDRTDGIDP